MPILVPRHLAAARRSPRFATLLGSYCSLRLVTDRRTTVADLTHALAKLRRSDVIRWLATVSAWIGREGGLQLANQLKMADTLLSSGLRQQLQRYIEQQTSHSTCVFHRRQLWFVLQMAMIACKEDTPEASEEVTRDAVGECCLMASDILMDIDYSEKPGSGPESFNEWIASVVIPLLESKDRSEILARAQAFWFDLPADPLIRRKFQQHGAKDFDAAFLEKYGMPLREFFGILFELYLGFEAHALRSPNPLLLDDATYLRPYHDSTHIDWVLRELCQTPDELALKLLCQPRQNWSVDFTPLRESPVIQVFPGKHACPDRGLLYRCMVDRIYFLLQKAYPDTLFNELFGYLFEEYIHRIIRNFAYDGDLLARTFYCSPTFQGTGDEACDGLLHWVDTAVVLECQQRFKTGPQSRRGPGQSAVAGSRDKILW